MMKIVPFKCGEAQSKQRGCPPIRPGTTLYALRYEDGGYYWYSYLHKDAAEEALANLTAKPPVKEWNVKWMVTETKQTNHKAKKAQQYVNG